MWNISVKQFSLSNSLMTTFCINKSRQSKWLFFLTRMLPTCKYNKTLEIPFQSNTFFFIFYNLSYTTLVIPHKWIGTTVESAMIKIAHAPVLSVLVGAHLSLCTQAVLRFPWWTWGNWGSEWWERLEMSF